MLWESGERCVCMCVWAAGAVCMCSRQLRHARARLPMLVSRVVRARLWVSQRSLALLSPPRHLLLTHLPPEVYTRTLVVVSCVEAHHAKPTKH